MEIVSSATDKLLYCTASIYWSLIEAVDIWSSIRPSVIGEQGKRTDGKNKLYTHNRKTINKKLIILILFVINCDTKFRKSNSKYCSTAYLSSVRYKNYWCFLSGREKKGLLLSKNTWLCRGYNETQKSDNSYKFHTKKKKQGNGVQQDNLLSMIWQQFLFWPQNGSG